MRSDALFKRYELFASAASIAAHARAKGGGFRQRDVRFLIELFSNWVQSSLDAHVIPLSNTQISRYLESLAESSYLKRVSRKGYPRYRLTRAGLIELLSRIVHPETTIEKEHFLFSYSFLFNYKARLLGLVEVEGSKFPLAMKLEVEDLLDTQQMLSKEIDRVSREIEQLEFGISNSTQGSLLAKRLYRQGADHAEVIQEFERQFPYQLNSQKPLHELLAEFTEEDARWELEEGTVLRSEHLFVPTLRLLKEYQQVLEEMANF